MWLCGGLLSSFSYTRFIFVVLYRCCWCICMSMQLPLMMYAVQARAHCLNGVKWIFIVANQWHLRLGCRCPLSGDSHRNHIRAVAYHIRPIAKSWMEWMGNSRPVNEPNERIQISNSIHNCCFCCCIYSLFENVNASLFRFHVFHSLSPSHSASLSLTRRVSGSMWDCLGFALHSLHCFNFTVISTMAMR